MSTLDFQATEAWGWWDVGQKCSLSILSPLVKCNTFSRFHSGEMNVWSFTRHRFCRQGKVFIPLIGSIKHDASGCLWCELIYKITQAEDLIWNMIVMRLIFFLFPIWSEIRGTYTFYCHHIVDCIHPCFACPQIQEIVWEWHKRTWCHGGAEQLIKQERLLKTSVTGLHFTYKSKEMRDSFCNDGNVLS